MSPNTCPPSPRSLERGRVGEGIYAFIHVSENASIAVVNLCPAISRGAGLPGSALPSTVIVAAVHGTNRLGIECLPVADLSGGSAKQNGVPRPLQVSTA